MYILLIIYGIFQIGIFLAWIVNIFSIDAMNETLNEFLHYYRNGNIFGKLLATIVFVILIFLTLPEVLIAVLYFLITEIICFLKNWIERKCYPNIVRQEIKGVPSSEFQLLRDADINFSIGKDYIIVTGLDDYEKAKKILGKDAFNCNSEQK